jgi:hypothetical protein
MAENANIVPTLSMEEIEVLVKTLLHPGPSHNVQQNSARFHEIQRSVEGWQTANFLLGRDDPQVRFYGAHTFQVKLKADVYVIHKWK